MDKMASLSALPQPHVPAWKKLGLKLKYAKEDASPAFQPLPKTDIINEKKRKHTSEAVTEATSTTPDLAATKPSKKTKTSHPKSTAPSRIQNSETHNGTAALEAAPSSEALPFKSSPPPSTPAPAKRKSVSFTPETKASDGQSSKDLYAQWLATQKAEDPAFSPPKAQAALRSITPAPAALPEGDPLASINGGKTPKRAKAKKKKKEKASHQPDNTSPSSKQDHPAQSPIHPALIYLTAFTTSPSTWKFSKNHQTHLLKHLFSLSDIPPSYTTPLKAYIAGLKGAAARARVRERALQIRADEEMWFSDLLAADTDASAKEKKRRREAYEDAWRREGERVADAEEQKVEREAEKKRWLYKGVAMSDWERNVAKRRRAEELIWALGEEDVEAVLPGITGYATNGTTNGTTNGVIAASNAKLKPRGVMANGKRKRVRKRRTTGVPDDESSSSSSSSSSESSGEEDGKTNGGGGVKRKPGSQMAEDQGGTSSGEDSDSSSGSSSSGSSDDSD